MIMVAIYEKDRDTNHDIVAFATKGCSPHFHHQVEILCVAVGNVHVSVNDMTYELSEGDISIADSFDIHSYDPAPESVGYVLILPERYLRQYLKAAKDSKITRNIICDPETFNNVKLLMEMILKEDSRCSSVDSASVSIKAEENGSKRAVKNEMLIAALSASVIGCLFPKLEFSPRKGGAEQLGVMRRVLGDLCAHFDEDVTLTDLAMRYGYTPNHFSHLFNAYVRMGLKQYLNTLRIENAAALLKSGGSVTDAAMNSGFTSLRTFYRFFEAHYKLTPNDFLKGNR